MTKPAAKTSSNAPARKPPRASAKPKRLPLSRERIVAVAMDLADRSGLEAVTLRAVAERLGVEAMSLYRHVANKDDILDGLVETVLGEMTLPDHRLGWRELLRERALAVRSVLLRHRWAAMLVESRTTPTAARLRVNDDVVGALRGAGFSIALAYGTLLAIDSYTYGFALKEAWPPFEPEGRPEASRERLPVIMRSDYPHLVEMMDFLTSRAAAEPSVGGLTSPGATADFELGLGFLLDGIERARTH